MFEYHTGHFKTECIECGKVISQCRCMDRNKPTNWVVCQECKCKTELVNKCDTCFNTYPMCDGVVVFGIDKDPSLAFHRGADAIVDCSGYIKNLEIKTL